MDFDVTKITRFELIDHETGHGRVFSRNLAVGSEVVLSVQDDGRTLKVFLQPMRPTEAEASQGVASATARATGGDTQ